MMDTPDVAAPPNQPAPLGSLFEELRLLPRHPPRREMLTGLRWRTMFRAPTLILLPFMLLFTLFPLVILGSIMASKKPGQPVLARVIQVEHFGKEQVFVKYRYTANGRNYNGASTGIQSSLLQNLTRGAALKVSFDKADPQKSAPAFETAAQEDFPWPIFLLFPLMAAFFFMPLIFPHLRSVFLARKLLTRGVLTTGTLKFVKNSPISAPNFPSGGSQLIYEFKDESGASQRGATKCDNMWLIQQFHPESPVVVAYNPRKPVQNIILEPFVA